MSDSSEDDFDNEYNHYEYLEDGELPNEFPFNDSRQDKGFTRYEWRRLRRTKSLLVEKGIWRDSDSELEKLKTNLLDCISNNEDVEAPLLMLDKWHLKNHDSSEAFYQILGEIMLKIVEANLSTLPLLLKFGITVDHQVIDLFGRKREVVSTTALHHAVCRSDFETVKRLLEQFGADPNSQDRPRYDTPIMKFIREPTSWIGRRIESFKALLKQGADPNKKNYLDFTPIHKAVVGLTDKWKHWTRLNSDIDYEFHPDLGCSHHTNTYFNVINILLDHGASLSPDMCLANNGEEYILDSIVEVMDGVCSNSYESSMFIRPKLIELLSLLIDKGLDVERWRPKGSHGLNAFLYPFPAPRDMTLLMHCCCQQWTDMITLLLSYGVNPSVMTASQNEESNPAIAEPRLTPGISVLLVMFHFIIFESNEKLALYFAKVRHIFNTMFGAIQFAGKQPRWSRDESLGIEFVSRVLILEEMQNNEPYNFTLKRDFHSFVKDLEMLDKNPFDLKFYARRAIRAKLFQHHKQISFEVVRQLPIPIHLFEYVQLNV